jgi:hypothetical protein
MIPIICGIIAVFLGKDVNWDLRNYHYYNAYAFLEHRLNVDIAPAQLQTFLNPLLDLPFFWMSQYLSSKVTGFILGCIHGINLSLIFLIFCKITYFARQFLKISIGIAVLIFSGASPGFISELGGTMNDNFISLFVLLTIFLILVAYDNFEQKKGKCRIIITVAGFIMGAGVGLKPTIAFYALSSVIALMILFRTWQNRIRYFLYYSIAGIVGGAMSAGFWWWELWTRYANPLFPFFNNIFHSPYIQASVFTDTRFLPVHLWEYFVWPVVFSLNSQRVAELKFTDIRFAIVYLLFLAWGICVLCKSTTGNKHFHSQTIKFLLLFFALSFILWMKTFSIYRYLISLELFVPIIFLALLERIVQSNRIRIAMVITVTIALYAVFHPLDWGRVSWSDPYIYINIKNSESLKLTDKAVIVMLGQAPMAYVIPHFPSTTSFFRPEGNLNLRNEDPFFQKIKMIIEHQKKSGRIYVLFNKEDRRINLEESSVRLGLNLRYLDCFLLENNISDNLIMCRVLE